MEIAINTFFSVSERNAQVVRERRRNSEKVEVKEYDGQRWEQKGGEINSDGG